MSYKVCANSYNGFCTRSDSPEFQKSCTVLDAPDTCPYAYVIEEEEEDD